LIFLQANYYAPHFISVKEANIAIQYRRDVVGRWLVKNVNCAQTVHPAL